MKREDIIRLVRQAANEEMEIAVLSISELEKYTALVEAAEREACAKLCDDLDDDIVDGLAGWQYAEAIRARGQA